MITLTQGNLLEADTEALVNTVNTVGVMGKGIALMFKERFSDNFVRYQAACKAGELRTGQILVSEVNELGGPRWIVNFPTKQHWRNPSRMDWIDSGLIELRHFILEMQVRSIAIPPLGAGNGGLDWSLVLQRIQHVLGDLDVDIQIFEPTNQYQSVAKRHGVERITPARALIVGLIRRYGVMAMDCGILEVQKLGWFMDQALKRHMPAADILKLEFRPSRYGPYAHSLQHLLNDLDGSLLHSQKRISDAEPLDTIWFDDTRESYLETYLKSEAKAYLPALEEACALIQGFESPFGVELLSTVDWLLTREQIEPTVMAIREGLCHWAGGAGSGQRKNALFEDRHIQFALDRLAKYQI